MRAFNTSVIWWASLKSEWQQFSSGLQDSSEYSEWFQQRCSLDVFESSSDFQFPQFPFQALGHRSKRTNYNLYHGHLYVPYFSVLQQGLSIRLFFRYLFSLWSSGTAKCTRWQLFSFSFLFFFFFLLIHDKSHLLDEIGWSVMIIILFFVSFSHQHLLLVLKKKLSMNEKAWNNFPLHFISHGWIWLQFLSAWHDNIWTKQGIGKNRIYSSLGRILMI